MLMDFDVWGQRRMNFFTGERNGLKLKYFDLICLQTQTQTCSFSLHKIIIDGLWIIVMFLWAVWTLILMAPIHCRVKIYYSHWWFNEEPITSMEPFHCTKGSLLWNNLLYIIKMFFTLRKNGSFKNLGTKMVLLWHHCENLLLEPLFLRV